MTTADSPADEIPLAGSTMVITGASQGIGYAAALEVASLGAGLVMVGRSPENYRAVQSELDGRGARHALVEADLRSLASVAKTGRAIAADAAGRGDDRLILINNAATAGRRGVTDDGFELAFGVNYLSHFLLTSLLLESGLPLARVVNVSSNAHFSTSVLNPDLVVGKTRSLAGWREYSHSKAALAAMTVELAQRYPATMSLCVHPGVVATGLWRRIPRPFRALVTRRMLPSEIGALPVVRAASDDSLSSGAYLTPEGVRRPGAAVLDAAGRATLWDSSLRWVRPFMSPPAEKPPDQ